jgi:hypothetical protein
MEENMLIGTFYVPGDPGLEEHYKYYLVNGAFTNSSEELKDLALWINSPWSYEEEKYTITCKELDFVEGEDRYNAQWECEYEVIGYDAITAVIYGYGGSPSEAFMSCTDLFERLQQEYNPDDKSV